MGLLSLFKRIIKGSPLSTAEVDSNWEKIENLFPTPASGNTDVGKTVVLKADKTGFEYVSLPGGGGLSTLFPNGISFINSDYAIQSSDEGKCIISMNDNPTNVTMPLGVSFEGSMSIGVCLINGGTIQINPNDVPIEVLGFISNSESDERAIKNAETLLFTTYPEDGDGNGGISPISTTIINDGNTFKTALKYLYDKIDKVIDLGTVSYENINASPADSEIEIPLSNIPTGNYVVQFYVETNEFDNASAISELKVKTTEGFNIPVDILSGDLKIVINHDKEAVVSNLATPASLELNFDLGSGETNPQNFTQGSIKIKALIKQFPS